jgi:hypothetical protein
MRPAMLGLCLLPVLLQAVEFEEMKQRSGARSIALAEGGAAALEGSESLAWNPAGISRTEAPTISLAHTAWVMDLNTETLNAVVPTGAFGTLGILGNYLSSGAITQRDSMGQKAGSYTFNVIGGELHWAKEVNSAISLGVGAGYWSQETQGRMLGQAATSAGVQGRLAGFTLGLAGTRLISDNCAWQASLAKQFSLGNVGLGFSGGVVIEGEDSRYGAGLEASLGKALALRFGYQRVIEPTVLEGLSGLTAGVGFGLGPVSLDYGYMPMGELGQVHRIGLSYAWLQKKPATIAEQKIAPIETPPVLAPAIPFASEPISPTAKPKSEVELKFVVPEE